jgi:nitrite reductase (NADH) large subunit
VIEEQIDGQYFYFVFRDSYMVSAILLGDTTLSAAVKQIVEKRHDCSGILQRRPRGTEILEFVAEGQ